MPPPKQRLYIKVIHIGATDSPNVRLGIAQKKLGQTPTDEQVVKGVLSYSEYILRQAEWDDIRQRIGLEGRFWEGSEVLMYPPHWIDRAERLHVYLKDRQRIARGMGVDSGEGVANTSIAVVDEFGLINLRSEKTKDTARIPEFVLETMHEYNLPAHRVLFDRGGGGLQHADFMRRNGYNVKQVSFQEKPNVELQRHKIQFQQKIEAKAKKFTYYNKRAEMYGEFRYLLDPGYDTEDSTEQAWKELANDRGRPVGEIRGFAINPRYHELRRQMAPIPLKFELEKLKLPPKYKKDAKSKEISLHDIIGCSPDELDAVVLAIHAMQNSHKGRAVAGAI